MDLPFLCMLLQRCYFIVFFIVHPMFTKVCCFRISFMSTFAMLLQSTQVHRYGLEICVVLRLQPLRWRCAEIRGSPRTECARRKTPYMWREQATIEWSRRVMSIVACCHSVKLCAHAARAFPVATVASRYGRTLHLLKCLSKILGFVSSLRRRCNLHVPGEIFVTMLNEYNFSLQQRKDFTSFPNRLEKDRVHTFLW